MWDIIAVTIVARRIYRCVSRGFVSTLVSLLVYIGATGAAIKFNKLIAEFLYHHVVYDAVRNTIAKNIESMASGTNGAPFNIMAAIPANLRLLMGHGKEQVLALPVASADKLSSEIIELALRAPLTRILDAVSFLLLFTLTAWFVRWLSRYFTGINKIPVIGTVNTVLGGVAGVILGILALVFSGFVIKLAVAVSGGVWWWLNSNVMADTYIWRHFY